MSGQTSRDVIMSEISKPTRSRGEAGRTMNAQVAFDVAQLFVARFSKQDVNGYAPTMRPPMGVSTEGGRQALQHIVLESKTPGESAVTVGHVNLTAHSAKLRTHECLNQLHAMRFPKKLFPLDAAAYQLFFDAAQKFLSNYSLAMEVEARAPELTPAVDGKLTAPPAQVGKRSALVVVGIVALMLLVATFAVLKITRRL